MANTTGLETQRDSLYRRKHAGVPGNGGQTAEHPRDATGKSVLTADKVALDADAAIARDMAEAAQFATSPLDLIDRRTAAVEKYLNDKYEGDISSVSFVSDGQRIMVMSASNRDGAPIEDGMVLSDIEDDLNDVIPFSAMGTFTEGMTLMPTTPEQDSEHDRFPEIGEETLAEYTDRIVAKWSEGQLDDNLGEVEAAAREFAYNTYNDELNEHALSGGEITPAMLDGLNEPNTRYFVQHYGVTVPDAPESLAADQPGLTRPIEVFDELDALPAVERINEADRSATKSWLIHEEDGKRVYAEVSVHHSKNRPGNYSGKPDPGMASSFRVFTETPTGSGFVTKAYEPMSDAIRLGYDDMPRWNRKYLAPALATATEMLKANFDHPQIKSIMSRAHKKVESIVLDVTDAMA